MICTTQYQLFQGEVKILTGGDGPSGHESASRESGRPGVISRDQRSQSGWKKQISTGTHSRDDSAYLKPVSAVRVILMPAPNGEE